MRAGQAVEGVTFRTRVRGVVKARTVDLNVGLKSGDVRALSVCERAVVDFELGSFDGDVDLLVTNKVCIVNDDFFSV